MFHFWSLVVDSADLFSSLCLRSSLFASRDDSWGAEEVCGLDDDGDISASQKMVPRDTSMKMAPSGARSVLAVKTVSGMSVSCVSRAYSAGLFGRDSGGSALIRPCIRAYPKYSPDLLAENKR